MVIYVICKNRLDKSDVNDDGECYGCFCKKRGLEL